MIRVSLCIIQSVCSVCVFLEESGAPLSLRHAHMLAQRGLKFTFRVGFGDRDGAQCDKQMIHKCFFIAFY